jgi:hypothetical protein
MDTGALLMVILSKKIMENISWNISWILYKKWNTQYMEHECNTPGVCHSLSSGFELKHDRLSGDDDVKSNLRRWAWPKVGCCPIALHIGPFSNYMLGWCYGNIFICLTLVPIYSDPWKSFMKFGIKKSHEMISFIPIRICTIKWMEL